MGIQPTFAPSVLQMEFELMMDLPKNILMMDQPQTIHTKKKERQAKNVKLRTSNSVIMYILRLEYFCKPETIARLCHLKRARRVADVMQKTKKRHIGNKQW